MLYEKKWKWGLDYEKDYFNCNLINAPLLLIAGEKADSRYMSEDVFKKATGTNNKELYIIPTRKQLLDVITVALPYIGYPRTLNALAAINSVVPAK